MEEEYLTGEASDGYHTFNELYMHRNMLFLNLISHYAHDIKNYWTKDPNMDGWILVVWNSPNGQISYHMQEEYIEYLPIGLHKRKWEEHDWDGHTSNDVISRLKHNI